MKRRIDMSEIAAELRRIRDRVASARARADESATKNADVLSGVPGGESAFLAGYLEGQCESAVADINGLLQTMGAKP